MIFARVALFAFLIAYSLATPIQLARRGPFPWEVFDALTAEARSLAQNLFQYVPEEELYTPVRVIALEELRTIVGFTESTHPDAPKVGSLFNWFEDELGDIVRDDTYYDWVRDEAFVTLQRVKEAKVSPLPLASEETAHITPGEEAQGSSLNADELKEGITAGAVAAAALGGGGVAYGAHEVASQKNPRR